MNDAPTSPEIPARLRAQAIAALVPFFVDSSTGDEAAARLVAEGLLDDYRPATPKELQLAAQIVALGWASLACLSAAMVVKDKSLDEMLRLQGYALGLDRLSQKTTKALEARRKERAKTPNGMPEENTRWDEGAFQLSINQALEKMNEANTKLAAFMAALTPPAKTTKLPFLSGEPMTPSILARRRRG
jgi:hypothetical protein